MACKTKVILVSFRKWRRSNRLRSTVKAKMLNREKHHATTRHVLATTHPQTKGAHCFHSWLDLWASVPCAKFLSSPHSPFSSKGEWGGFLYTINLFFNSDHRFNLPFLGSGWVGENLAGVRILKPINIRLEPKWPEGLFQPPPKQV